MTENLPEPLPEKVSNVDKKSLSILEAADKVLIEDVKSYNLGISFLKGIRSLRNEINETFDASIALANQTHKSFLEAKRKHSEPLDKAEYILKNKVLEYRTNEEKKRVEEERRLVEIAKKQEEEELTRRAEELIAAGNPEDALLVLGQSIEVHPIFVPEKLHSDGVIEKHTLKVEVIDLVKLIKAVADGKLPISLLEPNIGAISGYARACGGASNIDGVKVFVQKSISVRNSE